MTSFWRYIDVIVTSWVQWDGLHVDEPLTWCSTHGDACIRSKEDWIIILSGRACYVFSTEPLFEPMMTCYVLDPKVQILVKFKTKYNIFLFEDIVGYLKVRIVCKISVGHIVHDSIIVVTRLCKRISVTQFHHSVQQDRFLIRLKLLKKIISYIVVTAIFCRWLKMFNQFDQQMMFHAVIKCNLCL